LDCTDCISPTELSDVDDEDIETDLNTYVDIAGDNMTGDFSVNQKINLSSIGDINISNNLIVGGNVGIGTNPQTKFHIKDLSPRLRIEGTSGDDVGFEVVSGISEKASFITNIGTGVTNFNSANNYTWRIGGTPRFFLQATNGFIGINTVTPAFTLDVNGNMNSSSLTIANYKVNISSSGDVNATKFYGDGTGITGITATDGSKIANGTDASLKNLNVTLLNVTNNTILLGNLSVDTNVLYVDADNNNVGIGTSTPSGKLEISGGNDILTINADNTIGKVWQSFTAGGSTYGRFIVNPQGVEYSGNDAFSNPSFFFMNSSVAIGTRSADFRLDVNGTASFNETMFIQSGIVNISGNLIINNYKVNISSSGDVNATKFYGDGSELTGILTSTALNEINLGLTQNITNTRTSIDNNITKARAEISSNATDIRSSINLNYTNLKSNISAILTNISNLNKTLGLKAYRIELSPFIQNNTDAKLRSLNITNSMAVDTNVFYVDASDNRVGIGTVDPIAQLEVSGTGSSTNGSIKAQDSADSDMAALDPNYGLILHRATSYINNNKLGGDIQFRVSSSAGYSTTAMTLDGARGYVGIGTASPASNLHVYNTTKEVKVLVDAGDGISNSSITLTAVGSPHVYGAKITFDPVNGNTYFDSLFSGTGSDIHFRTKTLGIPAVEALFIESAGKIGIGTITPSETLTVVGDISATSNIIARAPIYINTSGTPRAWNHFGNGSKDRAEVSAIDDVYISGNLEVDAPSFFSAYSVGDISEVLQTKNSRNNLLCKDSFDCLSESKVDKELEYGDVVCIDTTEPKTIMKCTEANSKLAAGVVSNTSVLNMGNTEGYPISVAGIVYTKVTNENGNINPGDLLVSASTAGFAMANNEPKDGTVIGKSFDFCDKEECRILMFVALS